MVCCREVRRHFREASIHQASEIRDLRKRVRARVIIGPHAPTAGTLALGPGCSVRVRVRVCACVHVSYEFYSSGH